MFLSLAVVTAFSATSCYKIINTTGPLEVTAGETFEVSMTVADDGNEYQQFVSDWSLAGVRVPEGWTVKASTLNHRQFAEDWVYYENGTQVAKAVPMSQNDNLTKMYNDACKKDGYEWFGFQTRAKTPKFVSACWRNGCDSIRVTFNVTVPEGFAPGTYTIDFIGGDEEDDEGADKYSSYADALGTRVFHVGTFNNSNFEHSHPEYALNVEVKADLSSVGMVKQDDAQEQEKIYTADGKRLSAPRKGINIINGKKILDR